MLSVGQKVVCIDDKDWLSQVPIPARSGPVAGGVYTIDKIEVGFAGDGAQHEMVHLVEKAPAACWYLVRRFRPVQEPSIEVFRSMLTKKPTEAEVDDANEAFEGVEA